MNILKNCLSSHVVTWLASCLMVMGIVIPAQAQEEPTSLLMPKPHEMTTTGASFALNRSVSITDPTNSSLLASLFTIEAGSTATVTVNMVDAATLGTFDYTLADFDNEGYKLVVEDNAITITAATKTGVIRAAQTLMQLAAATGGNSIPGVDITDWAAFKLRGYMHDVGRSFVSFEELKHEVDLLSRFKVNVFHWHLTDNQGFRFESKLYPQLNQAANMTRFAGQYYTQAQCTELEAYAAERGLTIIPEIDMPGHSQSFQRAMGFAMNSDEGKVVLKALLDELAAAFPNAPYLHIGCDEAGTTAAFVNEMSQYVKETLHRRVVVWNPISGVTISKANLPYIDMTEMWGSAGRKIDGLPNIDCRYNYINHFDVFADLVGIYKSNIYYTDKGNSEVAGAISGLWNDRKTPTETDIIRQNNLWANAIATAERGWMGGGKQYIETGGTTLPNSGDEFDEFQDWERRFLYYKGTWLSGESIPYVKQTNVKWRITQAFPNGGTASTVFPPEESNADILPDQYTYNGNTYTSSIATGAGIYLRHVWGTTVPAFFPSPQLNTTAYAWTYVYSPVAQTAGARIEFHNYSRSENGQAPANGNWDRKGSRIWVNGTEIAPPTWTNAGRSINSEVDLQNENFTAREPISINLNAGWNKVFLKLPYVNSGIRLNKWMFTFVLTDAEGNNALEGITYSPIKSLDPNVESVVSVIGDIKTYINSKCGTAVGKYPASTAASLLDDVATVEATLQSTLTASEREAQVTTLTEAFNTFKSSLASAAINQPLATTSDIDAHYYTLCTPQRGTRYVTSTGANSELAGHTTVTRAACWKFISRQDGTWDIVNAADGSYISPASDNNTALNTTATSPATGWTIGKAATDGLVIIISGSVQFNQTNNSSSVLSGGNRIFNWGSGNNTTDTGCQYLIAETELLPSTEALYELEDKQIDVSTTAATELTTGQWYIMKNCGRNSYLYENTADHKLYTQTAKPSGIATNNAKSLVRLVGDGHGGYYLQTGLGNYFGTLVNGAGGSGGGNNNGTTGSAQWAYTTGTIASGYFWLKDANGVIMDANASGGTVAGWGTSAPGTTSSNAAWQFFPVELSDFSGIWPPTAEAVYTINNTNGNRGALVYDGSNSRVGLVASANLNASNANHQWVLYPTGTDSQYYLYNVGAGKFAIPTSIAQSNQNAWVFSNNAVAVTLLSQDNGSFRIKMASNPVSGTNEAVVGVNVNLNPAVFNYNDAGSDFTFTQVPNANASTAVTAAVARLVSSQTPVSSTSFPQASGWYAMKIKRKDGAASYVGRFVKYATTPYNGLYPLAFAGDVNVEPAVDDPTFFTYITHSAWNNNRMQLPDGRFLVKDANGKFPVAATESQALAIGTGIYLKTTDNTYAEPNNNGTNYYLSENGTYRADYTFYPIDIDAAGLTPWQVTITNGNSSTRLTCNREDVHGLTSVFNNGYFFLPTGVTPTASDFAMEGMVGTPVIDAENKTVTVEYDPTVSMVPADVTVQQGNQTTGRGNTMQALLRVKAVPFAETTPTEFNITLTGADQLDKVAVYTTTASDIHAANANPQKIGEADAAEGAVTIATTNAQAQAAGSTLYYWITANIKADAEELATVDAALNSIAYSNAAGGNTCDLTAKGNPEGVMRIFKTQAHIFTGNFSGAEYYRIPTILNTADGGIAAFADYRYDNTEDLGKPASGHKIDVVMKKSTDGGLTWSETKTIAAGDGSTAAGFGYGDPAVVRTLSGKLICLAAAGQNSYPTGMRHMAYMESTDNGATWTAPTDIYGTSRLNTNGTSFQSVFTTAGDGVTFSNGRVAFAMNGKVNGTTNDYIIYSDDEGANWTVTPNYAFTGGDESKLEIMNDNSLLISVRRGGWNSMADRGFNHTTGDASAESINSWQTQGIWSGFNANGCNADVMYYSRSTEGEQDIMLHTLTKTFQTYRRDLRLYMSVDQGATWTEIYQLQPGFAAYSSMQKLANGDVAIIFEDGSIGNQDKMDCYSMNYIVISKEHILSMYGKAFDDLYNPMGFDQSKSYTIKNEGNAKYISSTAEVGTGNALVTENAVDAASFVLIPVKGQKSYYYMYNSENGTYLVPDNTDGHIHLDNSKWTWTVNPTAVQIRRNANHNNNYVLGNNCAASGSFDNRNSGIYLGNFYQANPTQALNHWVVEKTANDAVVEMNRMTAGVENLVNSAALVGTPLQYTANVGQTERGTVVVPFDADVTGDVEAYTLTAVDGNSNLQGTKVETIEANKPVLLKNSGTLVLTAKEGTLEYADAPVNGLLHGVYTSTQAPVGSYVLQKQGDVVAFFHVEDIQPMVEAFRAYLTVEGNARMLTINFDGETTGINSIDNGQLIMDNGAVYDLQGRKMNGLLKSGLYIINGKKIIIK